MSDAASIKVDFKEFHQTLKEYIDVTKKDLATALNRCCKNISIKAIQHCPQANKQEIKTLLNETKLLWWIAWQKRDNGKHIRKVINDKSLKWGVFVKEQSGISLKSAYKYAQKRVVKRTSSVGFVKGFFSAMSKAVDGKETSKKFQGIQPSFTAASTDKQKAEIGVKYDYQNKNIKADVTEVMLTQALQLGVDFATKDMKEYIEKKLQEASKKASAK